MTRSARRAIRANAAAIARKAVEGGVHEALPGGRGVIRITDPAALAALEAAFAKMLRAGGKPLAEPLSEAAARGFPSHCRKPAWAERCWLLVAPDRDGRLAFATEWTAGAAPPALHAAFALADPVFSAWRRTQGFGTDFTARGRA